jgi:hypothetical protein
MTVSGLNVKAHAEALLSVGESLGFFDSVQGHEPKSAPDNPGVALAVFGMTLTPLPEESGLTSASVRIEFQMRCMKNMLSEPQDQIDLDVLAAADGLLNALAGGYTLGGIARNVDVLGQSGEPLRAQAGYVSIGGGQGRGEGSRMFRVMDVFVPIIVNDCWIYGE